MFYAEKNLGGAMIFGFLIRFKESRFSYLSSIRLISLTGLSLLLLLSCLTVGEVSAATYYVAKTGNDSNVGSATAPFKTIQKAAAIVNPGDTVIVKDGTYTDTYAPGYLLYLTRGGNASNWITFKSETKWGAVLDGQNTAECVSFTRYSSYIRIENFEIKNCTVGIISADTPGATNNYIYGNHIHHAKEDGIDLANGSHNFTIDSNVIHDVYLPETNQYHGIYVAHDTSNTTIINNIIYDCPSGWPIHLYSHGSPNPQQNTKIINNTFADPNPVMNGHIIIAASSPNLLIENNIFYNPTDAAIRGYTGSGTNIVISNNITNSGSICTGDQCGKYTFSNNQTGTNPSFADAANRDYHLQSNSPAINAGLSYAERSYDADGKPIVGVPDIGAYEYAGAKVADTTPPAAPKLY